MQYYSPISAIKVTFHPVIPEELWMGLISQHHSSWVRLKRWFSHFLVWEMGMIELRWSK